MSDILFWYFLIGVIIVSLGILIHSCAWNQSYKESLIGGWMLWVFGLFFWPLGLDLLLMHEGYSGD